MLRLNLRGLDRNRFSSRKKIVDRPVHLFFVVIWSLRIVSCTSGGSGKYGYNLSFFIFRFHSAGRTNKTSYVSRTQIFFSLTNTWTLLDNTVVHKSNCTVHGTSNRRRRCGGRVWRAPYVQRGKNKTKKTLEQTPKILHTVSPTTGGGVYGYCSRLQRMVGGRSVGVESSVPPPPLSPTDRDDGRTLPNRRRP